MKRVALVLAVLAVVGCKKAEPTQPPAPEPTVPVPTTPAPVTPTESPATPVTLALPFTVAAVVPS